MPLSTIACLGLSHNTAPVSLRERLSCTLPHPDKGDENDFSENLKGRLEPLSEFVLLSTCNRIELYSVIPADTSNPRRLLLDALTQFHHVPSSTFDQYLFFYQGEEAATHLARVATGLDSMVLGEPQILGQVNDAYMRAVETGTIGLALHALFRAAIRAGKRARTETAIANNPASISSVAIALAQEIVGDLQDHPILIVGLGEMGQLALRSLRKRGLTNVSLANRSLERARSLADGWGGAAYSLEQLPEALAAAKVVISATAAPHTVIDKAMLQPILAQRAGSPLVLIDIAVPRDVDQAVRETEGVELYNMDDLQAGLDEAQAARQEQVPAVEEIIDQEMACLEAEMRALAIRPVIADLRQRAEMIRRRELARTMRFLGDDIDPEALKHIQHLSRSLVNKLLHEPTLRLREKATNGEAEEYAATVCDLFDLQAAAERP